MLGCMSQQDTRDVRRMMTFDVILLYEHPFFALEHGVRLEQVR